ncbi:MAG: GTPase Era [Elusimicrobia bacterium]|nr:GTPase Era [Elusimicrobiota bacterium]
METPPFKSGFVSILGRPNAGKSTLLNALLGTKLSIVSPKPQTTRHRILGLLNGPFYQIAFLDTPGFITRPKDPLQKALRRHSEISAREDADISVIVVEPRTPASALDDLSLLRRPEIPAILVLNKIDLAADAAAQESSLEAYRTALNPDAILRVCALSGAGTPQLIKEIVARLPQSPPFYPPDQASDRWERFFASEFIREQVFALYREEIPHATAVTIEEFKEKTGRPDAIRAVLYVEKEGQKGIIIGAKGAALHELQKKSRLSIEKFLGRPVELEIWVKVRKDWRKDPHALKEFGY